MDEADQQPARDQIGLAGDDAFEQRMIGALGLGDIRIVPGDDVVGELAHALGVAARGEELEGADADVARRHAGEHGTGQHGLALNALAGGHRGQRAGGRDAQGKHRLADDVFPQHGAERGAAVAPARERRWSRSLELDVAAHAVLVDHLAKQDGPAIAELGHEMAELVAGIGHRDRVGAVGEALSGEDFSPFRALQHIGIEAEMDGQGPVQLDQPGGGDGGRGHAGEKVRRQRRIGVLEREMDGHDPKIGAGTE